MVAPIDPTATGFLLAETGRCRCTSVGCELFEEPEGAGRDYGRQLYESMRDVDVAEEQGSAEHAEAGEQELSPRRDDLPRAGGSARSTP